MQDLNKIYLFRMTHIDNIPHILSNGITHPNSKHSNPHYKAIGDRSLINSRKGFILDNGKKIGQFIPFYFGVRMPMLYVIQNGYNMVEPTKPEDIVYCVTTVQKILDLNLDFIFTDGHAVDSFTRQFEKEDIQDIKTIVDWTAVNAKYWFDENDLDKKRRKEAEFLVLGDIDISAIIGYRVYNDKAFSTLTQLGIPKSIIRIKKKFYF